MDLTEARAGMTRRHPWEVARLRFFTRVLRAAGLCARPLSVLDAGSGDGWFAAGILPCVHPATRITCWDTGYDDDARERMAREGDPRIGYLSDRPARRFDLLLLLDVLEHVEDDEPFLRDLVERNLEPGGRALISVPAWRALYGDHDVRLRHFRRYQPREAASLLERAGLAIQSRGGLFASLLLPRLAETLATRAGLTRRPPPHIGEWRGGTAASALFETVLDLDGRLSVTFAGGPLEIPGLSWWALCAKRSS